MKISQFWHHAISIYLFQGLSIIVNLPCSIIIARILGPEGKGEVNLFSLLTVIVVEFGLLGITGGLFFHLSNKKNPLSRVHGSALFIVGTIGGLFIITGLLMPKTFQILLGDIQLKYVIYGLMLSPFYLYSAIWNQLIIGINKTPVIYKLQFFYSVLNLLITAGLWWYNWLSISTVIISISIFSVMTMITQFIILLVLVPSEKHLSVDFSIIWNSFKFGLKTYPGFIANWLHFRVDQLLISHLVGKGAVGIYALSVRWVEMLWMIGYGIINAGIFRIVSDKKENSYRFTKKLFLLVLGTTGFAGLLLSLLVTPLFHYFYGETYTASILPLLILIPGVVTWDAGRVLSQYISFKLGKPEICTGVAILGAIINFVGTWYGILKWGIIGAALASTVSYCLVLFFLLLFFYSNRF